MVLNKRKKDEDEILDTGVNNYPNLGSKDTVKKLAEDYANYNYDAFAEGDSYKALEKRYQTGGQKAMQDTVGQVSARTGGLASSYATVAGQQTYNDWMGNLESAARALYDSERQEMGDRYALANSMYLQERDEQRYADELAYNRGRDTIADQRYAEELAYNRGRDQLADDRYIEERDYNRAWNEDERTYNRSEMERLEGENDAITTIKEMIAAGVPVEEIDPALIEQSGYGLGYWGAYATNYNTSQSESDAKEAHDKVVGIIKGGGTISFNDPLVQASGMDETEFNSLMSMQTNANNASKLGTYTNNILNGVNVTLDQWKAAGGTEADYNMYKDGYATIQNNATLKNYADIIASGGTVSLDTWVAAGGDKAVYDGYMSVKTNSSNQNTLDEYMDIIASGGTVTREQWIAANGTEDDYNSNMSIRTNAQAKADEKTTKEKADSVIKSYIDAFGKLDGLDESWFEKSSMPKDYWTSEVQKATNLSNQNTLSQYMVSLSDGVFVDRQAFIDAGGDAAVYDAYKKAYDDAKAKGEAANKAIVATSALNALIETKADVDWDSEEIQQLIKDSGKSELEWSALIAQMNEDIQADIDAEAAAEIATAEEDAAEEMIMRLTSGETLEQIGSGLMASTGKSDKYWQAYERIIRSGEAEEVAEAYRVDFEDAANWMAEMDGATTYDEASRLAYTIFTSTQNEEFAQSLLSRWTMKHGAAQG